VDDEPNGSFEKERTMISTEPMMNVIPYPDVPRHRHAAVMFVDLDHFMRICIDDPPEAVFGLLGDFQYVVTDLVSRFGGELNSYQGDGALATFSDTADSATRTLRCARMILEQIRVLSSDYGNDNSASVSVSIGLQYGETWTSTLASSRSFGPTLIGDAVNVAARLEKQAHRLGTKMVVGDELIQRARRESLSGASDLAQFADAGPVFIPGRHVPVHVWTLKSQSNELRQSVTTRNVDIDRRW
jgi:adenylate cyclase